MEVVASTNTCVVYDAKNHMHLLCNRNTAAVQADRGSIENRKDRVKCF